MQLELNPAILPQGAQTPAAVQKALTQKQLRFVTPGERDQITHRPVVVQTAQVTKEPAREGMLIGKHRAHVAPRQLVPHPEAPLHRRAQRCVGAEVEPALPTIHCRDGGAHFFQVGPLSQQRAFASGAAIALVAHGVGANSRRRRCSCSCCTLTRCTGHTASYMPCMRTIHRTTTTNTTTATVTRRIRMPLTMVRMCVMIALSRVALPILVLRTGTRVIARVPATYATQPAPRHAQHTGQLLPPRQACTVESQQPLSKVAIKYIIVHGIVEMNHTQTVVHTHRDAVVGQEGIRCTEHLLPGELIKEMKLLCNFLEQKTPQPGLVGAKVKVGGIGSVGIGGRHKRRGSSSAYVSRSPTG